LVTISVDNKADFKGYGSSQFRYAFVYVIITLIVLFVLNIYCSKISQMLFYKSKQTSMIEKCQLAADEIVDLEIMNTSTITSLLNQMDSMTVTRLITTDQSGSILYDSSGIDVGKYALFPEILRALDGNNVFTWYYHDGTMTSRAATPIVYYGTIVGCVYITEYDTSQGLVIQSLQNNILQITFVLEIFVILFALIFSNTYSRRMKKIMTSMRVIQEGNYTHHVSLGGNDELTLLGDEFNELTRRLHTSEQKRHRFVSDASHELKTPLASIKLLTDSILQNDMDQETTKEFVEDIGNEADRLTRMTEKLLALTKADGQQSEESEIIYFTPTIRRVVRMLSPRAYQSSVQITMDLDEDTPVLIREDDLYQIIFNLVENGIKYNVPNGTLNITLKRQDENAYLIISDSGMGIPDDAQEHVFERFYRVDKARSRATGGSGLGLAIVKSIVLRNRGEIHVSSVLGQGTEFTVVFPSFDTEVDKE